MTARSTGEGVAASDRYAGLPAIRSARGLTGYTGPVNPPSTSIRTTSWPTRPGCRLAPITATDAGASSGRSERCSAVRSRRPTAARAVSSSRVGSSICSTLWSSSCRRVEWGDSAAATSSMGVLVASTSPRSVSIPSARAAAAMYSRSRVPMPSPCQASSTRTAKSAVVKSSRSYDATPTRFSAITASRARWSPPGRVSRAASASRFTAGEKNRR